MKVYLDFVFLINFFFDFVLLFGTRQVLKKQTSLKRIFLGGIVGALSTFFLLLPSSNALLFLWKICLSGCIILVTFGKRNFFKNLCYFYLLSIILGGTLYLFDITFSYENHGVLFVRNGFVLNFLFLFLATPIIIFCYVRENIKYKRLYANSYPVEIYMDKKQYKLEGMLDTGNHLTDPYKKRAVILVNCDIQIAQSKFIYVPYKALNTSGVIPCFSPDRVIINNKVFTHCLIGVSKERFSLGGAECILPNQFKEDL